MTMMLFPWSRELDGRMKEGRQEETRCLWWLFSEEMIHSTTDVGLGMR